MITFRICIYFDLLVLLGKSLSWHPARTGCVPLAHSLGALTCWHCSCLNVSGLASVQSAVCSHPCPRPCAMWAEHGRQQVSAETHRKATPALLLCQHAQQAGHRASPAFPSPLPDASDHLWLSHGTRIQDQTQRNGYTALIQAQKNGTKKGGTLSVI